MSDSDTPINLEQIKKNSKLFAMLDDEGRSRLLAVGVHENVEPDTTLFVEGDTGSTFYIVQDGQLKVLIDKGHRKEQVATLSAGACVGEIAALMNEERSATVVTDGTVAALRFDASEVQKILSDYPTVREALVKEALERSEENLQELLRVTQSDGDND